MGCFNMKCALTMLPITCGDPVVLLFGWVPGDEERFADDSGGYYHQLHHFKLISIPVFGEYNDYGWIEKADRSLKLSEKFISIFTEEKFKFGDHWNDNLDQLKVLFPTGEQGDASFNPYKSGRGHLGYTFVHRKAWDKLITLEKLRVERDSFHVDVKTMDYIRLLACASELGINVSEKWEAWTDVEQVVTSLKKEKGWFYMEHSAEKRVKLALMFLKDNPEVTEALDIKTGLTELLGYHRETLSGVVAHRAFAWFKLLEVGRRTGKIRWDRIVLLLDALETHPELLDLVIESNQMFSALLGNQLIIRGSDDLPTQSQESQLWGMIGVNEATTQIIHDKIKSEVEHGDDNFEGCDTLEKQLQRFLELQLGLRAPV